VLQQSKHIHVSTDLQELSRILEWFQSLTQASVTEEDWMQCQIAIAEGFTNAVRYAHQALPSETPIEIDLNFYPDHIEMRIWDYGPSFSLKERLEGTISVPDESESGRGLMLLKEIANEVKYERVDEHRNCLLLLKHSS
jgi:serine/threonine-protein kinase RsbW